MHPNNMIPEIREVWLDFKNGKTDLEEAKTRMNSMKPLLLKKYG